MRLSCYNMTSAMSITISLTSEAEARLRRRAQAAGEELDSFVQRLVEQEARRPTLEEISGPIHAAFQASGMTEDELTDHLEEAKHAMRAGRSGRKAS